MKAHKKLRVLCASAVKLNASLLPVSGNSIVIPMPFKNSYLLLIPGLIIANLLTACTEQASKNTGTVEIGEIELTEYESLIAKNDLLLGMPVRIKHDYASGHLFILDAAHTSVIELDVQFNEIRRYGTKGRGPGEVQFSHDFSSQQNIFLLLTEVVFSFTSSAVGMEHLSLHLITENW
jgi:hypothetical protein